MKAQTPEIVHELDVESLRVFADKGKAVAPGSPQVGAANAVKVRRVLQIVRDLAAGPLSELRVLDVACAEGVYAIEAALRGAQVVAFDARTERMALGIECARKHGLGNLQFEQNDLRRVTRATHGEFDVIFFMGVLYHLDAPDIIPVLQSLHDMCRQFVIIETQLGITGWVKMEHEGRSYAGRRCREHGDSDADDLRRSRVGKSLDNTFSFEPTRESMLAMLAQVGFTSVLECVAPAEQVKPWERVTWVAFASTPVQLSSYPWVNGLPEEQLRERLRQARQGRPRSAGERGPRAAVARLLRRLLALGPG